MHPAAPGAVAHRRTALLPPRMVPGTCAVGDAPAASPQRLHFKRQCRVKTSLCIPPLTHSPPPPHTHTTPPTRTCSPLVPPPYTQETDHGFQPCTHLEHANYLGRCAGPWSRRLALVAHVVILFDLLFRSLDTAQASAPLPPFPPCRELQRAEFALLAGAAYVQD